MQQHSHHFSLIKPLAAAKKRRNVFLISKMNWCYLNIFIYIVDIRISHLGNNLKINKRMHNTYISRIIDNIMYIGIHLLF